MFLSPCVLTSQEKDSSCRDEETLVTPRTFEREKESFRRTEAELEAVFRSIRHRGDRDHAEQKSLGDVFGTSPRPTAGFGMKTKISDCRGHKQFFLVTWVNEVGIVFAKFGCVCWTLRF